MHAHKPNPLVVTLTPLDPRKVEARREDAEADVGANAVLKTSGVE